MTGPAWFGPTLESSDVLDEGPEWPPEWASAWWSEEDTGVEMVCGGCTSGVERCGRAR